ncbi:MAG: histone deacetylase superfamily protein, partial [bacterium]
MSVALFTHPDMLAHRPGVGHPESPERLQAVLDALDSASLGLDRRAATEAAVVDLERLHPADHVARLIAAAPD